MFAKLPTTAAFRNLLCIVCFRPLRYNRDEKSQIQALNRVQAASSYQDFLFFLHSLNACGPAELEVHLVVSNYATCKGPEVRNWLVQPLASICITPRPTRPG